MEIKNWQHVFKVDPAKNITDEVLEALCESGTDAIIVGGTDNVTIDSVLDFLARIRRFTVPVALEISNLESVTPGYDYYLIPTVLNSTDTTWVKDLHHEAIKAYGDIMMWDELIAEGYCILNGDCKAAKLSSAKTDLDEDDVVAYARMAENFFRLPVFYMEYSGTYGDPQLVKIISQELQQTQLIYGGGITSAAQAEVMAEYADTIVVGNIIYDDLKTALQTVKAVKDKK
ncbi:MAG TPA: heptaprenylglyceryl phosphate synthase [Rummeliibacillus sp.]|nr:heptaprenylglyceryl phosphate synthase [Rummeliibacillus sp.]